MENFLLPPFSLVIYLPFVILILMLGKKLAGPEHPSAEKSRTYGGGESAHKESSIPGYSPFILIAFFFRFTAHWHPCIGYQQPSMDYDRLYGWSGA